MPVHGQEARGKAPSEEESLFKCCYAREANDKGFERSWRGDEIISLLPTIDIGR